MTPKKAFSSPSAGGPSVSLSERVQARLAEADSSIELRRRAQRPGAKRKRAGAAPAEDAGTGLNRETRALAKVFHELGDAHRQHRKASGERVSPALKGAADAFKAAPSVATLTAVAAFLDAEGLLAW